MFQGDFGALWRDLYDGIFRRVYMGRAFGRCYRGFEGLTGDFRKGLKGSQGLSMRFKWIQRASGGFRMISASFQSVWEFESFMGVSWGF